MPDIYDDPEVVDGEFSEEERAEMVISEKEQHAIMIYARKEGRAMTTKQATALDIITRGVLPKEAIKTLKKAGGVPYIDHIFITRLLNNAFGNLWGTYDSKIHVSETDGSVAYMATFYVDFPVNHSDGSTTFYRRTTSEVGSFEAYPATTMKKDDKTGFNVEVPLLAWNGRPVYTMAESDRIASAASRFIPRVVSRAFGVGQELVKDGGDVVPSPAAIWRLVSRMGHKFGLTDEEIEKLGRQVGVTTKPDLVAKYEAFYDAVYDEGMRRADKNTPFKD